MITQEAFAAQLEKAGATMDSLPVSSALLRALAQRLKGKEPKWWPAAAKAWEKRKFAAWTEAWGLFLTALHYEALSDAKNPLVPYFPSCGGSDEVDPSGALDEFLRDAPKSFFENLRTGHRRVFVEMRAPLWVSPAALLFQKRGLSFYLVEANAGAGLNLAADLVVPQKRFRSDLIEARIGLDPMPLDLSDIAHRRWLTAGVLPDQIPMIAALDKAVEKVLARERDEAAFLQLAPCAAELAPKFCAKNVPADDEDVGLLFFNMGTTVRMDDADYAAYRKDTSAMLKPWGDRAIWVEVESVRGELYSTTYQLRVHRLVGGELATYNMATFDFAAHKTEFDLQASAKFLA